MDIHEQIIKLANTELDRRKSLNSAYSLRAYAMDLEVSNSSLSQVLSQKRALSRKLAVGLIDSFKVSIADKNQLKKRLNEKVEIKKLSTKHQYLNSDIDFVSLEASEKYIVSNWWAYAILTVGKSDEFDGSLSFLKSRLNLPLKTVEECIEHLCNKKLCEKSSEGKYRFTKNDFTTTHNIPNPYLRKQHKSLLSMASEKIDRLAVDQRDFSFVCMNANKDDILRMKQWISKFRREFMTEFEDNSKAEPFRLCIQLFPINEKDFNE